MKNENCAGFTKLGQVQEKCSEICNSVLSIGSNDKRYFCRPTHLVRYLCNHVLGQGKNDKSKKNKKNL